MNLPKKSYIQNLSRSEMAYFTRMTSTTKDPNKKNIVLMGRNTWDCIPKKFRPLANRINFVLSRNNEFKVDDGNVLVSNSLENAVELLQKPELLEKYESIWVIGGSHLYKVSFLIITSGFFIHKVIFFCRMLWHRNIFTVYI